MFSSVTLKFSNGQDLVLPTSGITIFVGPNNSGKSLLLREIEQAFLTHPFPSGLHLLRDYEVKWPSPEEVERLLESYSVVQPEGLAIDQLILGRINPNGGVETAQIDKAAIKTFAEQKINKHWWITQFMRWGVLRLDGRSRFNLTNDQGGGDLLSTPQNVLAHLFQDDASRKKVRAVIKDAFGMNFVVDPTNLGQLRIRLS